MSTNTSTKPWINRLRLKQDLALAIHDYDMRQQVMAIIDTYDSVDLLDRDMGKEPVLESKTRVCHVSYADGTGGFESRPYTDWMCPVCGWFVGELYSGHGRWHIQGDVSYCARCGQKIDWTKPEEEEKRRYEERKAKEREEFERKHGIKLDNMFEGRRRKYGMITEGLNHEHF